MQVPALTRRRTTLGVFALAVVGAVLRLVALGARVFHWDEARVGYWILQYQETGQWTYRAVVHGPFLFHVNDVLFELFGPSDFVARLVVAVVGAALPLTALLFRERLRPVETLAFAAFLAVNPVLLYYSRFMRNDVLVAAFALAALGFFVRLVDTGRRRHLYAGTAALALAFTTKEIVLVYLGVWVGALALLLDHRLLMARYGEAGWRGIVRGYGRRLWGWTRKWWPALALAAVEFAVVIVFFYAPRPDLYQAFAAPARFPSVVEAATLGAWDELWHMWITGGHEHSYVEFFVADLQRLATSSVVLLVFAVGGFLVDRYGGSRPNDLVAFGFYWAAAIFVIYPAITDISAPWGLVHVVVPLAFPAAAGARLVVEQGQAALATQGRVSVGLVAIILLAVVAQVGVTAYDTAYANPQSAENPLVQFGQPGGQLHEELAAIDRIAAANEGTDVVFYGDHFYVADESNPTAGPHWTNRFPLTWYLERSDATLASTRSAEDVDGSAPVVIALAKDYSTLSDRLPGYRARTYEITATDTATVFFVNRSAPNESAPV
ncbi:MAG: flippase activity-associated protein Agl23 [Halanaeroarchaeum sp.]